MSIENEFITAVYKAWVQESNWAHAPISGTRFVVLDTETEGLNPRRDRIITIGAVAVRNGEILLDDSIDLLLRINYNSSSVTVHGITADESQRGITEAEAMREFLPYLADGVIVGHHIGHDVTALNEACQRQFGLLLQNPVIDTMELALHLEEQGWSPPGGLQGFSLDELCRVFHIAPHDRHTAAGDAFLTALVFLRLLHVAEQMGYVALERLLSAKPAHTQAAG